MEMEELLTMQQVQKKMKLCKQSAYNLIHMDGFPVCRVGRKILVPADKLQRWIDEGGTARQTAPDRRRS